MPQAPRRTLGRGPSLAFGAVNVGSAALLAVGVFRGLPERWPWVDVPAAALIALLALSGGGLVFRSRWAVAAARVAGTVTLVAGLTLVAALALSASYLAGIYGPVGEGGAIIFLLVMALAIPYLVALPVLQLSWLRRPAEPTNGPSHESTGSA